jgi:hypothetical protein
MAMDKNTSLSGDLRWISKPSALWELSPQVKRSEPALISVYQPNAPKSIKQDGKKA